MPTPKYVYFAPDGKWFESSKECEEYEKIIEIANAINKVSLQDIDALHIAKALLERYKMEERWNYKHPEVSEDYSPAVTPEEDDKI